MEMGSKAVSVAGHCKPTETDFWCEFLGLLLANIGVIHKLGNMSYPGHAGPLLLGSGPPAGFLAFGFSYSDMPVRVSTSPQEKRSGLSRAQPMVYKGWTGERNARWTHSRSYWIDWPDARCSASSQAWILPSNLLGG
jgi:hypothetical protein